MKFDKLVENIMENVEGNIVQMVLSLLDKNGVKYEKNDKNYTKGAIKHSIEYSFEINDEEFVIEEFVTTNGKKHILADISVDEFGDSYMTYDDYQMLNIKDFVLRLKNTLGES
jgi:hypothetical protein